MLLAESLLGTSSTAANYIEDVFSTYLYTGTGASQTITNGIDLSGKGGLVWLKGRSGATDHALYDTARGATFDIASNTTAAQTTQATGLTSFGSTGFTIGALAKINTSSATYAAWTFRKQAKFFDVVTYTGNGVSNRTVSHSLGSVPGCIFFKITSTTGNWVVLHQNNGTTPRYGYLNLTSAMPLLTGSSMSTFASSATFSPGALDSALNLNGATYVAYLFAHNAGGFGASGSDNVISCGSFTTDGSGNATVSLGYEPQWLLVKVSSGTTGDWRLIDNMRGFSLSSEAFLRPNSSVAETVLSTPFYTPTSTGFKLTGSDPSLTFIYIAIRRGPMKTPTSGTSVFYPLTQTGNATNTSVGFPADWTPLKIRNGVGNWLVYDRLRGINNAINFNAAAAESSATQIINSWSMNGMTFGSSIGVSDQIYVPTFRRAPGFFDVVCYTGTGSATTFSHNLGAVPGLMIVKSRDGVAKDWRVYAGDPTGNLELNSSAAFNAGASSVWNDTSPTASVFSVGNSTFVNESGKKFVNYLFGTVAGVSKVGSYTGTGTTKQIDCGFTGGARFVLIKRTDSTGDWYVWDSARGIVAGNDPYLLLNSTAAEVTGTDYIDTYSAGFEISSTAPAAINASGGSFIFLAIA